MKKYIALAMMASALIGGRARASSGRQTVDVKGTFFMEVISQAANETLTISTSNLSSGGDTVLHVQSFDDPNGGFVAGNDDFTGLASQVTVPPNGNRTLRVIVRSYYQTTQGTCTVTFNSNINGSWHVDNVAFGGSRYTIGSLADASHIMTAELQGGISDSGVQVGGATDTTMLLVDPEAPEHSGHGVVFDDDDGVGFMSWNHTEAACGMTSSQCFLIVANFSAPGPLKTNIIWDQDAEHYDSDGDGLGNALEQFLGTGWAPGTANQDTDQDGISDYDEVVGHDGATPIKFPLMGADPLTKDIFVEADWQRCTTPSCGGDIDHSKLTGGEVATIKSHYLPVHVHFDLGTTNTDPSTYLDWGNWGGASRQDLTAPPPAPPGTWIDPNAASGCEGMSPERQTYFRHGLIFGDWTGHVWYLPGGCFTGFNSALVVQHEMGHTLGLRHGGRPNKIATNFKPHYQSFMNYLYQNNLPQFSSGTAPVPSLNPSAVDETVGLGSTSPALSMVQSTWCPGGTCVNLGTGAVDWNRDGVISPKGTLVQGAVALVGFTHDVESNFTTGTLNLPAMTWVSVGGSVGDQLWIVGRGTSNQMQRISTPKTTLNAGCGSFTSMDYENTFNCAGYAATPTDVGGGITLSVGPGVAELNGSVMSVYQPNNGYVSSKQFTINSSTGAVTEQPTVAMPGNVIAIDDITALSTSAGVVKAWAPSQGRLKQWTFSSNAWTGPVDQQWSDGTFINPLYGIGATMGFQDSSASQVYAAIVTSPNGLVELARQGTDGKWTKISAWSVMGQPSAFFRPGLAYQHRPGQNSVGRFYLGLNVSSSCPAAFQPCNGSLIMTEGNLSSGSTRRLQFIGPPQDLVLGGDGQLRNGISLINDMTRDANLRAAVTRATGQTQFLPLADGIINAPLQDLNDWAYVQGALRAALSLDCSPACVWPNGVLPASLP